MAAYSTLTPSQQAIITSDLSNVRALLGQLGKFLATVQAYDTTWTAQTKVIATSLDSGTVIPDSTGLAGAGPITTDQYQQAMALLEGLLGAAFTPAMQQLIVQFCGPTNIV